MKAIHIFSLVLATALFFSCGDQNTGDTNTGNSTTADSSAPAGDKAEADNTKDTPTLEDTSTNAADLVYAFHNVVYDVALSVTKKQGAIDFVIDVSNLDNNCKHTVKGTAKAKDGDLESREIDGEGIFVQEYNFADGKCDLSISIAMDSEEFAWITQGECPDVDPMCKLDPGTYLSLNP